MHRIDLSIGILGSMVRMAIKDFGHDDNYWISRFQETDIFELLLDTSLDFWKESTENLYDKMMEEIGLV